MTLPPAQVTVWFFHGADGTSVLKEPYDYSWTYSKYL